MKQIYRQLQVVLGCLLFSGICNSQVNPIIYSQSHDLQKSMYQPASLGTDSAKINLSIPFMPSIYIWGGNDMVNLAQMTNIVKNDGTMTNQEVDQEFLSLKDKNTLGVGAYYQPFAFSIRIPHKDSSSYGARREKFTLSFSITERIEFNTVFNDKLAQLLWKGNAQFEGQRVDLGNTGINGFWQRDFGFGFAKTLLNNNVFKARFGMKLKYILGMASVYTEHARGTLSTLNRDAMDVNAKNTLHVDYLVHTAYRDNISVNNVMQGLCRGIGIDMGTTVTYKEKLVATLSLLDLGSVRYNMHTNNYASNTTIDMEGAEITSSSNTEGKDYMKNVEKDLKGSQTKNAFAMPLPSRMILGFEYKIFKSNLYSRFPAHHFFINYVQGFKDLGSATRKANINMAYTYNITYKFGIGSTMGFGGCSGFNLGLFLSGQLGSFNYGLGSNVV